MARFVFRLEAVLKQRKRVEQDKQRELAVRHAKLVVLEDQLKQMDETLKQAAEDLRNNHLTGSIDMNFLTAHRRFLMAMQREGAHVIQQIAAAKKHEDEARVELAEAAKRRKAIDRLRERAFERWQSEQSKRELAAADEINTQLAFANLADES